MEFVLVLLTMFHTVDGGNLSPPYAYLLQYLKNDYVLGGRKWCKISSIHCANFPKLQLRCSYQ